MKNGASFSPTSLPALTWIEHEEIGAFFPPGKEKSASDFTLGEDLSSPSMPLVSARDPLSGGYYDLICVPIFVGQAWRFSNAPSRNFSSTTRASAR